MRLACRHDANDLAGGGEREGPAFDLMFFLPICMRVFCVQKVRAANPLKTESWAMKQLSQKPNGAPADKAAAAVDDVVVNVNPGSKK